MSDAGVKRRNDHTPTVNALIVVKPGDLWRCMRPFILFRTRQNAWMVTKRYHGLHGNWPTPWSGFIQRPQSIATMEDSDRTRRGMEGGNLHGYRPPRHVSLDCGNLLKGYQENPNDSGRGSGRNALRRDAAVPNRGERYSLHRPRNTVRGGDVDLR